MSTIDNALDPFPYCSLEDFTTNSLGADISQFANSVSNSDAELTSLLLNATTIADEYCQTNYQFQQRTEMHNWRGKWDKRWEVIPYFGPIRKVTQFDIAVTAHNGEWINFPVACTPIQTSVTPPNVFGQIFVDREVGYVQTVYIMLKYGMGVAYLATPMNPPQVILTYTCGYNQPDADPTTLDGYSFPVPRSLREGTRHIAKYLVNERALNQMGMGNVDALKVGARSIRRVSGSGSAKSATSAHSIPSEAKLLLQSMRRMRFA